MFSGALNLLSYLKYGSIALIAFSFYMNYTNIQEIGRLKEVNSNLAQKLKIKSKDLDSCIETSLNNYYNDALNYSDIKFTGVEDEENVTTIEF
jgi:DNA topoisomerase VI subunit A